MLVKSQGTHARVKRVKRRCGEGEVFPCLYVLFFGLARYHFFVLEEWIGRSWIGCCEDGVRGTCLSCGGMHLDALQERRACSDLCKDRDPCAYSPEVHRPWCTPGQERAEKS